MRTMAKIEKKMQVCCICGKKFKGWGNNPIPVKASGRCCDRCDLDYVIPARIARMFAYKNGNVEQLEQGDNL